jgi:hypothetical protein
MNKKRFSSFTLPETTVYIAVIVFIAYLSVNSMMNSWWKYSFEQQTVILLKDIELARELSLYKREAVRICFYGSENLYRIIIDQDAPANSYYIERKLNRKTGFLCFYKLQAFHYYDEDGILKTGSINFGSASSESYGELRFTFEGVPSSGGHVALYSEAMDKVLVIMVKPVTGRARIGKVFAHYIKP